MAILYDLETDGLDHTKILGGVFYDSNVQTTFICSSQEQVIEFVHKFRTNFSDAWVGYNNAAFDEQVLKKYMGDSYIPPYKIRDMYIWSKSQKTLERGNKHSLDSWGVTFGIPKPKVEQFEVWDSKMENRCVEDVKILHKIYDIASSEEWDWLERESKLGMEIPRMEVPIHLMDALKVRASLCDDISQLEETLGKVVMPKVVDKFKITQKKDGSLTSTSIRKMSQYIGGQYMIETADGSGGVQVIDLENVFNPHSHKERIELLDKAGWNPVNKTPSGSYKVDETNLDTLPDKAPAGHGAEWNAANLLREYLYLKARLSFVDQCIKNTKIIDGIPMLCIDWNVVGTWSQRSSHLSPNISTAPSPYDGETVSTLGIYKNYYDNKIRDFIGRLEDESDGSKFFGFDAKSIQLRLLAHLMEDYDLLKEIKSGDPHQKHADILGCTRDQAKTFIYAWILHAGKKKIAEILGCSLAEANTKVKAFEAMYSEGLKNLDSKIVDAVNRGYFMVSGRRVYVPSEHRTLAGMLQSLEAIWMRTFLLYFKAKLENNGISTIGNFLFSHDEINFRSTATTEQIEKCVQHIEALTNKMMFPDSTETIVEMDTVKSGQSWLDTH